MRAVNVFDLQYREHKNSVGNARTLKTRTPVCGISLPSYPYRGLQPRGQYVFEKHETYTPTEAMKANDRLDQLVAAKEVTSRQASAHRIHIARSIEVALKPSYTTQAARRAKADILKLTEVGTIAPRSAMAYRAHITKRTAAA